MLTIRNPLSKIQQQKNQAVESNVEAVKAQLKNLNRSEEELLEICDKSLSELQSELQLKKLNPIDLLHAYQLKALKLKEEQHCGIGEFIVEAEKQANELKYLKTGKSDLYGIPISIKELIPVQGHDATYGLLKLCGNREADDCALIQTLRAQGAIPFIVTPSSQLALTLSGYNPVYGDMKHPKSDHHLPGGSSTGEAVLLSNHASPIGIGNDIAGSIRIPCAFCGLAGLKPTTQRLGYQNNRNIFTASVLKIKSSAGPMGRCVDDLVSVMRTLLQPILFKLAPSIPPIPFNEDLYNTSASDLKIGYYETIEDTNLVQSVPSVRRAVNQAVEILKHAGCQLIKFDPPEPHTAMQLGFSALMADGGEQIRAYLKNEPLNDHTRSLEQFVSVPSMMRGVIDLGIKRWLGNPAAVMTFVKKLGNLKEVTDVVNRIEDYRFKFEAAMKSCEDLDIIVCPVWPFPAPTMDTQSHITTPAVIYTLLYNVLDYPAGAVPMGCVSEEDVKEAEKAAVDLEAQKDHYHVQVMRSQKESKGLPLSVQVVGKPYREELVLRVMKLIEDAASVVK